MRENPANQAVWRRGAALWPCDLVGQINSAPHKLGGGQTPGTATLTVALEEDDRGVRLQNLLQHQTEFPALSPVLYVSSYQHYAAVA